MKQASVMMPSTPSFCMPGRPPRALLVTSLPRPGRRISSPRRWMTLRTPPLMSLTTNTAVSSGRILWRGWFSRSTLMISPVGVTMRHQSRLSRVVPYSKALGPPAFSETLPPMDEACLEAGSTEKSAPAASTALMTFWVMAPASTVTVMFSRSMGPILVRRVRLTMTVRLRAGTAPPVMPEPPPRGMRANFMSLASFTRAATCSALSGSTTSRGSSMRRSVASVAEATRAEGEERMHSPGRMLRRVEISSSRKLRSAS